MPHEDIAYRELTRWIELLLESSRKAEATALHHLNACQISHTNAVNDAKSSSAAKDRLLVAAKCLAEASKIQEANWAVGAILELVASKSIAIETRLRIPPSVLAWIDEAGSAST